MKCKRPLIRARRKCLFIQIAREKWWDYLLLVCTKTHAYHAIKEKWRHNCAIQGARLIWKQKIWLAICEFLWSLTNQNAWSGTSVCTELALFYTVNKKTCTALNQSEWRKFFMYIINTVRALTKGVFTWHRGEFRFPLMTLYLFTWSHHKMLCRRESPRFSHRGENFTPVRNLATVSCKRETSTHFGVKSVCR